MSIEKIDFPPSNHDAVLSFTRHVSRRRMEGGLCGKSRGDMKKMRKSSSSLSAVFTETNGFSEFRRKIVNENYRKWRFRFSIDQKERWILRHVNEMKLKKMKTQFSAQEFSSHPSDVASENANLLGLVFFCSDTLHRMLHLFNIFSNKHIIWRNKTLKTDDAN
jgi:hypothetical protein